MIPDITCREAEAALLGAIMLDPQHAAYALDDTHVDDFTDPRHRDVYSTILLLLANGEQPDAVNVLGALRRGGLARCTADRGPGNLLADLLGACPVPAAAPSYRRISPSTRCGGVRGRRSSGSRRHPSSATSTTSSSWSPPSSPR